MSLANKHIVITGAASGIGKATAVKTLARGARVTSLDLIDPELEKVTHIRCDVSKVDDWKIVADRIGKIDHLFLNAGIMSAAPEASGEEYSFFNVSHDAYRKVTGVNIDGVVFGLKALAPEMVAGSSVVVTASLAGLYQYTHDPIYALTKHAVVGLTRSVATALAESDIRINAICPNRVDTPMLPDELRSLDHLSAEGIASDVLQLFDEDTTGGVWTRTSEGEPLVLTGADISRLRRIVRGFRSLIRPG